VIQLDLARHQRLENLLAILFQRGTWAACLIVGFGLIFDATSIAALDRIGDILKVAGVALIIFLPIVRVTMMIFVFLSDRDYLFVVISVTVLVVILVAALLGIRLPAPG
jgi:uncharacterized membrane protein